MSRHLSMMSSVIARARWPNMGRTLWVSQSLSAERRVASGSNSIPKRISAVARNLARVRLVKRLGKQNREVPQ